MIFDTIAYFKEINRKLEIYQLYVFNKITESNPTWLTDIKEKVGDKTLNPDEVKDFVSEIVENENFVKYDADWDVIKELFLIDEKQLEKFKIEQ